MNQINQSQVGFFNAMTQEAYSDFGLNSAIFNELSSSLSPIVAAGPNQQGFSAGELSALNSQVINQAGNTYANMTQGANEAMSAKGGGNQLIPSGAQAQVQGQIGTAAENQEATGLRDVSLANYATGRQNYFNAVGSLSGVPGAMENPLTGMSNATTGAGSSAMTGANEINAANNSWMGLLGGVLGNAAGALTGGLTGGLDFGGGGGGGGYQAPTGNPDWGFGAGGSG